MQVTDYALWTLIGLGACLVYGAFSIPKQHREQALYLSIYAAVGALIGAKLLYVAVSFHAVENLLDLISSGFVYYGGLMGAIAGAYLYCREYHRNFYLMSQVLVPMIPLFHSFARIGCFFSGCCFGVESQFFSIEYISPYADPPRCDRIPVQLMEAAAEGSLFLFLHFYRGNKLFCYMGSYAVFRFFIEFLRGDLARGIFVLSTSQWISIFVGIVLFYQYKKQRRYRKKL